VNLERKSYSTQIHKSIIVLIIMTIRIYALEPTAYFFFGGCDVMCDQLEIDGPGALEILHHFFI